jgi:hypothetical protein
VVGALVVVLVAVALILADAMPAVLSMIIAAVPSCLVLCAAIVNARTAGCSAAGVDSCSGHSREDRLIDLEIANRQSEIANAAVERAGLELKRVELEIVNSSRLRRR